MRVLGLVGLVIALLVVGLLIKKQMGSLVAPASANTPSTTAQGRQLQQDIQKSLDAATQPRPMPDDKP
jgi:parvulin-like peptidyl-prolyl isomerase